MWTTIIVSVLAAGFGVAGALIGNPIWAGLIVGALGVGIGEASRLASVAAEGVRPGAGGP